MWIRSQSKKTLLKVARIGIAGKEIRASAHDGHLIVLGVYATNERSLEVLDAIENQLRTCTSYDQMSQGVRSFKETVYEMPQE